MSWLQKYQKSAIKRRRTNRSRRIILSNNRHKW
uniref:Ribosomal protein L20 n=1 Tax=Romanomermis culicivorax TaxID=13658 RepID=A0A915LA02_ROMCU